MSVYGQWELVGAPKKKVTNDGAAEEKKPVKEIQTKKAKVIKEAPRSLQQFKINDDKKKKKEESEDEDNFFRNDPSPAKTKNKSKKKSQPTRPKTLREAVNKLNLSELQSLVKVLRSQFANNSLVWLKDVTSFLNVRLNPSTPVDSAYRQESVAEPPLDYLSRPIREFLTHLVKNCNASDLTKFYLHCFTCMLEEVSRTLPVHGFAILIQVIQLIRPDVCGEHAEDFKKLRGVYDGQSRTTLTYTWLLAGTINAVAAAEPHQHHIAVSMWMDCLLPVASSKMLSALAVQCGKSMANRITAAAKKSETAVKPPVVTSTQLMKLMNVAFASSTQIPRPINKQLVDIYNKMRVLCCSNSSEAVDLFRVLLPRLQQTSSPLMQQQIAVVCAQSLQWENVWHMWATLLPKQISSSTKLLKLISAEDTSVHVLMSSIGQQQLDKLQRIAVQLQSKDPHFKELLREIKRMATGVKDKLQQQQQQRHSRKPSSKSPSFLWTSTRKIFWLLILLGMLGYGSVLLQQVKGPFRDTTVGRLAARAGVEVHVEAAVDKMATAHKNTIRWLVSSCEHVSQVVRPYLQVVQTRTAEGIAALETRFPAASARVGAGREWICDVAGEAWLTVRPRVEAAISYIRDALSSGTIGAAVTAATDYTARLLAVFQQHDDDDN